ncbi:MAG: nucleotide exchange factor GrpE [Bacteroidales bacterium]|nr:nucleotide exchange factor GrpE [Bacteroidales bacterium]
MKDMQNDGQNDMKDAVNSNLEHDDNSVESKGEQNETSRKSRKLRKREKEEDALKKEISELKDKHMRLQAEFDNYRKRAMKDRIDLMRTAGEDLLVKLLPILDDFDRAINHIEKADTLEGFKEGVFLIAGKFRDFMKQNGVAEIEAKGEVFDTDFHEAVTQYPAPSDDLKGKVVDVAEKGYKLHDKVIRFSKVIVGV